jgi:uncharacterized membrane protein YsdA (DUF1294 family)
MRPEVFHSLVSLTLTVLIATAFVLLLRWPHTVYYLLLAWLLAINLVTFGYYGYDKGQAGAGRRRVPELVLHALVYLGGTLGGYLGMRFFRHKTIKGPFRLVFWFIVVLQVGVLAALAYRLWKH